MWSIAPLENLKKLDLLGTRVTSAGLYHLSRLRRLEQLEADPFENDEKLRAHLKKTLKYARSRQLDY